MVYVVYDNEKKGQVMLVKAEGEAEVKSRLVFRGNEQIIACFTDVEIEALNVSRFAITTG